ncbi:MAG TPA: hypothetical protein VMR34_00125 [Candidatus Saccharimonadales bacterium]|nr:hypothetical protein [Candidatus Saccharimonadales bacterium]
MLKLFATGLVGLVIVVLAEIAWRVWRIPNEISRKSVHICIACFVAFWPLYLSYQTIGFIAILLLIITILSSRLAILGSIHEVSRQSFGAYLFPISILVLALIKPEHLIFTLAMLNLGLADGFPALIGRKFGDSNKYKVFGQTKSVTGTTSAFLASILILSVAKFVDGPQLVLLSWFGVFMLAVLVALTENIAALGTDDLLVPLVVTLVLKSL